MSRSRSPLLSAVPVALASVLVALGASSAACSSSSAVAPDGDAGTSTTTGEDGSASASSASSSSGGASGSSSASSSTSSSGASGDGGASSGDDAGDAGGDAGGSGAEDAGAVGPGILTIGRFDTTDPAMPSFAWPGSRVLARFDGTNASVQLTHTAGSEGAGVASWINVLVDGVPQAPRQVAGAAEVIDLTPGGVAAGIHTVEIEKRTEANVGTLRFEGFTFAGGAGLLAPPARAARRIELISESTIDGFGVEGNGPNDPATCAGGAPPQYNDARKSLAFYTADALSAEHHLIAFSGKGVARNNDGSAANTMASLWTRTLPEAVPPSNWVFGSWTPDVIVVSLGGADYVTGANSGPANFQVAYASFVADLRAKYGASPYVFLLVWSQLKDYNGVRAVVRTAIDEVVAGRPAGERTYRFQLPEAAPAVETGCYYHANDAHHQAMAALLTTEIKAKTGW